MLITISQNIQTFSDNTSLLFTGKTIKQIKTFYNLELKRVADQLNKANKLTQYADKSNLVLFRRPRKKVIENIILKMDKKQSKEKEYIHKNSAANKGF